MNADSLVRTIPWAMHSYGLIQNAVETYRVEHPAKECGRLLTWGDPYLVAWLEAVRGGPLTEEDYRLARSDSNRDPLGLT
jgi:hypothetical protein